MLHERRIQRLPDKPDLGNDAEATRGEEGPEDRPRLRPSLLLSYRFLDSINVPPILVTERSAAKVGEVIEFHLPSGQCGEILEHEGVTIFYANGLVDVQMYGDSGYEVCLLEEDPARAVHTLFIAHKNILIGVTAFPQAGISKEQILRMAASFTETK